MLNPLYLIYGFLFASSTVYAQNLKYMPNDEIKAQVSKSPWRILPKGDNYTLAADLQTFWNVNNNRGDYYHSGYWLNSFVEYQPESEIIFNLKLSIFNPSNSYGYNAATRMIPFFAVSWRPQETPFVLRGGDLGRITIGEGLLVEEKEMSGLSSVLKSDTFSLSLVKPGTSVYEVSGDATILQLTGLEGLFGISFFHTQADATERAVKDRWGDGEHDIDYPWKWDTMFTTLYSGYTFENGLGYKAEVAQRVSATARMAQLSYAYQDATVSAQVDIGGRVHDLNFWKPFVRHIDQDYISFEDRQKRYINSMNLLSLGNPRNSSDFAFSGEIFRNRPIRISLRNEFGLVRFYNRDPLNYFMFDNGIAVYPAKNPSANCKFSYSNIIVNSTIGGADVLATGSKPIHINQRHVRAEASIEF